MNITVPTKVQTVCRYIENAEFKKVSSCCLLFSLFGFETKPSINRLPRGPTTESSRMQMWRGVACVWECTVLWRYRAHQQGFETFCTSWPTATIAYLTQTHTKNPHTLSCSTTHMPILEGRNQPALKIDMKGEEPRSSGRGASRKGGRWQLVGHCFPDWAYGHSSSSLPSPAVGHQGRAKRGHTLPASLPWCSSLGLKLAQVASFRIKHPQRGIWGSAGWTVQGIIKAGNWESGCRTEGGREGGGGGCSDVMAWLASPLGHSWKWSESV